MLDHGEGQVPDIKEVSRPNDPEIKADSALQPIRTTADFLKSYVRSTVGEVNGAGEFLKEFEELQAKYPQIFPPRQVESPPPVANPVKEEEPVVATTGPVSIIDDVATDQQQAGVVTSVDRTVESFEDEEVVSKEHDVSLEPKTSPIVEMAPRSIEEEFDERAFAQSFPVTAESRRITGALQELCKQLYTRKDTQELGRETEELRQQLSDSLGLPDGRNMQTLQRERARLEEMKFETITLENLTTAVGRPFKEMDILIAQASPEVRTAYRECQDIVAGLPRDDYRKRAEANEEFQKVVNTELGITQSDAYAEHKVQYLFPGSIGYGPPEKAQVELIVQIQDQLRNARVAQNVYEKKGTYLKDLARKAGFSIYKGEFSSYKTKPLEAGEKDIEGIVARGGTRLLVKEAIKELGIYNGQYTSDNLRSPQTTLDTFNKAIPDAGGIVVERSRAGELGGGVIGTVMKGKVPGGIAGLRGESSSFTEAEVAVKAPRLGVLDRSSAKDILNTIEEAHVLEEIRTKQQELYPGTKPFVPESVLVQNYRGTPALVMEYVDPNIGIYRQREKLTPQQFRSISTQYFELLDVIHKAGFTCNDRKGGDIFYKPEEDRLVVLDWNVTHPSSSIPAEEHTARMNGDLAQGLKLLEDSMAHALTSEGKETFRALKEKVKAYHTIAPFDVTEIIHTMQSLPLAA